MDTAIPSKNLEEARAAIDAVPLWYHTLELAPGLVTPGWFDLRAINDLLPWPDVRGKRCLDVGPWDGFFAFELERRGASEVVAVDIADHKEWDWPIADRELGPEVLDEMVGEDVGTGFRVARELLGSSVDRVESSVYDLHPDRIGRFDVVVCGSLLLHLKDPVRALEAIRSVCDGLFLSAEQVEVWTSILHRHRPLARLKGGERCQWWVPNMAGRRRMLSAGGFEILSHTRPYAIPFGPGHARPATSLRAMPWQALVKGTTGSRGTPASAALARPKVA